MIVGAERAFVRNETNVPVVAVGVKDVAIIAEPGGMLVCDLASSQAVKSVAETLSANGRSRRGAGAQRSPDALAAWTARYEHWLLTGALPVWWCSAPITSVAAFTSCWPRWPRGNVLAADARASRPARLSSMPGTELARARTGSLTPRHALVPRASSA